MGIKDTFKAIRSTKPTESKGGLASVTAFANRVTISFPEETVGSSKLI